MFAAKAFCWRRFVLLTFRDFSFFAVFLIFDRGNAARIKRERREKFAKLERRRK